MEVIIVNYSKRIILCFICIMLVVMPVVGSAQADDLSNAGRDSWVGNYSFSEYALPNINMFYGIGVFKEQSNYFVNIYIDGFQTITRIKAKVVGDKDKIDLVFDSYLPDNRFETFHTGDILVSFKRADSAILTDWGVLQPILKENQAPGKVYFTKTEPIPSP